VNETYHDSRDRLRPTRDERFIHIEFINIKLAFLHIQICLKGPERLIFAQTEIFMSEL
jgi:hypothetical protein